MNNSIPIIDLKEFYTNDKKVNAEFLEYIRHIYKTIGFAYVINHLIPHELLDNIFKTSKTFFNLPLEEKLKLQQDNSFNGYLPLFNSKTTDSSLKIETNLPNNNESFLLVKNETPKLIQPNLKFNLIGDRRLPLHIDFIDVVRDYENFINDLSLDFLFLFSQVFNDDKSELLNLFKNPTTFLRFIHYPRTEIDNQFGFAPHTDAGFLTFLLQDECGGLQVQTKNNEWIDVEPIKYSFILNSGDMFKLLTNNEFIATPHRVTQTKKERYSIPFFFDPSLNSNISPLKSFTQNNNSHDFISINYGNHLLNRLNKNY